MKFNKIQETVLSVAGFTALLIGVSNIIETQRETDSENTEGYLMALAPAIPLIYSH